MNMHPYLQNPRPFYLLVAVLCTALLGYGYYLQFGHGLEPCPLCIFQRLFFFAVLLLCLAGLAHGPGRIGMRVYSSCAAVMALIGAGIAARQVWLQHLPPDQVPECGPGLDFMLQVFPLLETIRMVFSGSGECAEINWLFLSLSIAEWSLVCFLLLFLLLATHALKQQ